MIFANQKSNPQLTLSGPFELGRILVFAQRVDPLQEATNGLNGYANYELVTPQSWLSLMNGICCPVFVGFFFLFLYVFFFLHVYVLSCLEYFFL